MHWFRTTTACFRLASLVVLIVFSGAVWADDPKDQDKPKDAKQASPAEQYQSLEREYQEAEQAFYKKYQELKTSEEREKHFEQYPVYTFSGRFLELAKKYPNDPAAADALVWVANRARPTDQKCAEVWGEAVDCLMRDHIEDPKMGQVAQVMVYSYSRKGEKFLRESIAKNHAAEVKGVASLALAQYLKGQTRMAEGLRNDANLVEQYEKFLGKELLRYLLEADLQKIAQETEDLLESVIQRYGEFKSYRGTLADAASGELFEIRNLAIGKQAPDIEGTDIDGEPFKISDYRGKVVVLDFWGHW